MEMTIEDGLQVEIEQWSQAVISIERSAGKEYSKGKMSEKDRRALFIQLSGGTGHPVDRIAGDFGVKGFATFRGVGRDELPTLMLEEIII